MKDMKSTIFGFCLIVVLLAVLDLFLVTPSNASILTGQAAGISSVSSSTDASAVSAQQKTATLIAQNIPSLLPVTGAAHPERTVSSKSPAQRVDAYVWNTGAAPASLPARIAIPAIGLDAPIAPAQIVPVSVEGQSFTQAQAPAFYAAGWLATSASPGTPGNMVLIGHHNTYGEVFKGLVELKVGDRIIVSGDAAHASYTYTVGLKMIVPERDLSLSERLAAAQWIQPTSDDRLTLVTCWPYTDNTHRLIVVAYPVR